MENTKQALLACDTLPVLPYFDNIVSLKRLDSFLAFLENRISLQSASAMRIAIRVQKFVKDSHKQITSLFVNLEARKKFVKDGHKQGKDSPSAWASL
jgi:hypothetical protein